MKFVLTDKRHPIYEAFRIMAEEDFEPLNIKSGDIGGYVSKKENLDEDSTAWILDDAVVLGNSRITGGAIINEGAIVKNVTTGLNSKISNVYVSDIVLGDQVRIYGKDTSIVISDPRLRFRCLTANNYGSNEIMIAYSTMFGNDTQFVQYLNDNTDIDASEAILIKEYIPVIRRRFQGIREN